MSEARELKDGFRVAAIVIGLCALAAVVLHLWFARSMRRHQWNRRSPRRPWRSGKPRRQPSKGKSIRRPSPHRGFDADRALEKAVVVARLVAISLGVVGIVRTERLRVAGSGAALGVLALSFQMAIVLIGAIVPVVLVAGVLSSFGADI